MSIYNKNILVFDLETTGLPKKKKSWGFGKETYYDHTYNSKYNDSRIVSVAWSFIENYSKDTFDNHIVFEFIRKPKDFIIKNNNIHGISQEQALKEGHLLSKILNNNDLNEAKGLSYAIKNCDFIIAHNCLFDLHILMNECHRLKFNTCLDKLKSLLDNNNYICTGELGINICKIPIKSNPKIYKMPKLSELYFKYYNEQPSILHNAKADVETLLKIILQIYPFE